VSTLRKPAARSSCNRRVIIWIDAQLSPALARWIGETFGIEAQAVRVLGLRNAKDPAIFKAAREAGVVVTSKDEDFRALAERLGPLPQVLWVTCRNTSNARLREILTKKLPTVIASLQRGEPWWRSVTRTCPRAEVSAQQSVPPDRGHAAVLENVEGRVLAAASDR
jgi:predicted nuclease of predicted toxin-antitoxin system